MSFLDVLETEFMKLKRSPVWMLMSLAPLFMVIFGTSNFIRYKDTFLQNGGNPWDKMLSQVVFFYGSLLLPLSIAVLTVWLARIEHSNNNWKYLLTLPISRWSIYTAKTIVHIILVGLSMGVLYVGMIVAGKIVSIEQISYLYLLKSVLTGWVACLPILAIQMWLSIRFTNISIPISISLFASLASIIVTNSVFGKFYLWSLPVLSLLPPDETGNRTISFSYTISVSIIMFILIYLLGFIHFQNRDVQ